MVWGGAAVTAFVVEKEEGVRQGKSKMTGTVPVSD